MLTVVSALLGVAGAYRLTCKGYLEYWRAKKLKEKVLKKQSEYFLKTHKNKQSTYFWESWRGSLLHI